MVELTLHIPSSLAQQIQPISNWLPTIIELSLANFKCSHVKKASDDLITFLSNNPNPHKVLEYKISDKSQKRVSELLSANGERTLGANEENELDEWEKFNNICITLSIQILKLTK